MTLKLIWDVQGLLSIKANPIPVVARIRITMPWILMPVFPSRGFENGISRHNITIKWVKGWPAAFNSIFNGEQTNTGSDFPDFHFDLPIHDG